MCDSSSKYRTNDGSCNNKNNPNYGMNNMPYKRVCPAYDDKFDTPRGSSPSNQLPNVRNVSLEIASPMEFLTTMTTVNCFN